MSTQYDVVDENDQIIGAQDREIIHQQGLIHREVHVWFITPQREVIFQKRALNKDTFPGLLDATVGGHVERGQSYEEAALQETEEETGLKLSLEDLIFFNKNRLSLFDEVSSKTNHAISTRYFYIFRGNLDDLQVEVGKAIGFEAWPLEKLRHLNPAESSQFIPVSLDFINQQAADFIENLLKN